MKILDCPINGPRPINEFVYGGEQREMPEPQTCSDNAWADYVFNRSGAPGVKLEWWYHVPSATWFVAERNTVTDMVERTYLWGEA
jgi:sarcosine oxidase, subunit delta